MKYIRRNLIWIIILVGILVYGGVVYVKQEQQLAQKRLELEAKIEQHEDLLAAMRMLREEVEKLDNAETKESLAREKLNMIMPDEMIYVITFDKNDRQRKDEE